MGKNPDKETTIRLLRQIQIREAEEELKKHDIKTLAECLIETEYLNETGHLYKKLGYDYSRDVSDLTLDDVDKLRREIFDFVNRAAHTGTLLLGEIEEKILQKVYISFPIIQKYEKELFTDCLYTDELKKSIEVKLDYCMSQSGKRSGLVSSKTVEEPQNKHAQFVSSWDEISSIYIENEMKITVTGNSKRREITPINLPRCWRNGRQTMCWGALLRILYEEDVSTKERYNVNQSMKEYFGIGENPFKKGTLPFKIIKKRQSIKRETAMEYEDNY